MEGTSQENLPRRIGRYEVTGLIAERASPAASRVYIAKDTLQTSAKGIVIKCLASALTSDAASYLAAARDIAKGLRHENVVEIRAVGHEGKDVFHVMDYIPGETLARILRRLKDRIEELPPVIAAYIVSQACKGLHAAHDARFVHGHLTPADIFVGYDGSVRVLDVGTAEARSNLAARAGIHLPPIDEEYASPEQRQRKTIDRRSDVFSLGKILLELAFARLGDIAKGALDPDPAKRYQDAATLGNALDAIVSKENAKQDLARLVGRIFEQRIRDKNELLTRLASPSRSKDLSDLDYKEEEESIRPSGEAIAMVAAPVKDIELEHPADLDAKIPSGISPPSGGRVTSGAKVVVDPPPSDPAPNPVAPRYVDDTEARLRRQEETAVVVRTPSHPHVPKKQKRGKGLMLALVALLLAGGAAATIVVLRRRLPAEASTTTVTPVESTTPASASAPASTPPPPPAVSESPSAVAAKEPEETSIMIDTIPSKATVSIGGTKMGVSPLEIKVPKSDEQLVLEIKRPGYVTLKEKVTPNLNQRLKLTLVAAKGAAPAASNPYRKFE